MGELIYLIERKTARARKVEADGRRPSKRRGLANRRRHIPADSKRNGEVKKEREGFRHVSEAARSVTRGVALRSGYDGEGHD